MAVTASGVSRYLSSRGWKRGEQVTTALGRSTQAAGFRCEQTWDSNNEPCVRVSWLPGDENRHRSVTELRYMVHTKVAALESRLAPRYGVVREMPDSVFGGDPFLMVSEKEEKK